MSLTQYRKKRSYSQTPERAGKKKEDAPSLRFVVQEHAATTLHYDFRLEMEGVLKSWAVPKGPSLDLRVKRLAIQVEAHPFEYRNFEGAIPEGNYGAGTVIIWDEGTYGPAVDNPQAPANAKDKKKQEQVLLAQLKAGKLHFVLQGKKLKGEFALVKTPARGEKAWLLMKLKDEFATTADITRKSQSVRSRATIEPKAPKATPSAASSLSKGSSGRKS